MREKTRILIVDDEANVRQMLRDVLTQLGHRVASAASGHEALRLIRAERFDVVFLDLVMPSIDGLEVLKRLKGSGIAVVILTGHADVESAVTAMRLGAYDYLQKPFKPAELEQVLRRAAASHPLKGPRVAPPSALDDQAPEATVLVGADPKIQALRTIIEQVAPTDASVLITGETGTGKELVARLIHAHAPRATGPFVVVDLPAVPISLFESELFGYERGAFTGAVAPRRGKLEEADGGTLFLDEVGDLPPEVQAKLLRFLQEHQVTRIGGNRATRLDVRVISASNRDLAAMVEQGTFRRDLFHRLNVVQIDLPPLRERKGDIPLLTAHFMEQFCRRVGGSSKVISPETLTSLVATDWPGNIRELENVILHACILTSGPIVTPESLPASILGGIALTDDASASHPRSLAEADQRHILEVLRREHWNISRAARVLGIHRATLYRKLLALRLEPGTIREDRTD